MEKLGFELRSFHIQSERSTAELHPLLSHTPSVIYYFHCCNLLWSSHTYFTMLVTCLYCYFLIAHQTCFKSNGEAVFRTQDLSHAKRTFYHCTAPSFSHQLLSVIYYYHFHNPYEVITHISQCWLYVFTVVFLIAYQTCLKSNGEAGFRTQDLSHANRTLYHWATSHSPINSTHMK